jgi:hypothetical protein
MFQNLPRVKAPKPRHRSEDWLPAMIGENPEPEKPSITKTSLE